MKQQAAEALAKLGFNSEGRAFELPMGLLEDDLEVRREIGDAALEQGDQAVLVRDACTVGAINRIQWAHPSLVVQIEAEFLKSLPTWARYVYRIPSFDGACCYTRKMRHSGYCQPAILTTS